MKKILVPTDFSEGAFNALAHALAMAKMLDAEVLVVHAYSMPANPSPVMVDITDELKESATEELEKLERQIVDSGLGAGVVVTYQSAYGAVVDVVNQKSDDNSVDMVVMGTKGASGIAEKWLGSNAAAIARNIMTPLLAIPAKRKFIPIEKILFSTDMKVFKDPACLDPLVKLAAKSGAAVKFFHVRDSDDQPKDESTYRDQVDRQFAEVNPTFSFAYEKNIHNGIQEAIRNEDPSILVVVRHKYGLIEGLFHRSVSGDVINKASVPVLVLNG